MLFVKPVVINLHEDRFEVCILVLEICDNMEMLMGLKMCVKCCAMQAVVSVSCLGDKSLLHAK